MRLSPHETNLDGRQTVEELDLRLRVCVLRYLFLAAAHHPTPPPCMLARLYVEVFGLGSDPPPFPPCQRDVHACNAPCLLVFDSRRGGC